MNRGLAMTRDDRRGRRVWEAFRHIILWMTLCSAPSLAAAMPVDRCVNLSNHLEVPTGEVWGPVITHAHLDVIRAAGFDTVRLPVRFSDGWNGAIDPARLAAADAMVDAAVARGLNVIVVLHHFDELMENPEAHAATFRAIWAELSAHWRGAPGGLIFELLNEPNEGLTTAGAAALFAEVIPMVRADHPDRWLVLEGGDWAAWPEMAALPHPDTRIVHSFHYYDPFEMTHQLASWTWQGPYPAREWTPEKGADEVTRDLEAAARTTAAPILLGEFGVYRQAETATRAAWTTHVRREAERLGMGWCVWGFAADFRIFDATKDVFLPEMRDALID
jgi:endoglucanase